MDYREELTAARRHVSQAVARLVEQRARVFELGVLRSPTDEGKRLLNLMEETFELMLHHERALEAEVEGPNARLCEQLELEALVISLSWSGLRHIPFVA